MTRLLAGLAGLLLGLAALVAWLNLRGDGDMAGPARVETSPALIERGAYLARAGNCQDCHTPRGGAPYAGGRGIPTPFGTIFSSNLTPDVQTGIGAWSPAEFRRALHNGRSRDGRLLYPAFPYDSYTRISVDDADALFAFLRSLPAVDQPNRPHALRFPYDTQLALAVWRALYFRPGRFEPQAAQSADWNRGAYLVQGLGHCSACHAGRNALGAMRDPAALAGGLIPLQNWYAPGLAGQPAPAVASLLQRGVSDGAALLGPMAEVVLHSTQHLRPADLLAMALHLQSLPQAESPRERADLPTPRSCNAVPASTKRAARPAMATRARAGSGPMCRWPAAAPCSATRRRTWCRWCWAAPSRRPRQATRGPSACRPSPPNSAMRTWPRC
jgi:mono/diheme cytochrome c family protein